MQDINKQLQIARAELAAIYKANKEAAIAAAFKRTADVRVVIALKIAREAVKVVGAEYMAQCKVSMDAENALRSFAYGSTKYNEAYMESLIQYQKAKVLENKLNEARGAVSEIMDAYAPATEEPWELRNKIDELESALQKAEEPSHAPTLTQEELKEQVLVGGERRIDLIRSRMNAAKAVIPGEAQEWMPLDEDEATETVVWLEAKRRTARNPRRKEHRRNYLTQLDMAKIDAGNDWHYPKRNRHWYNDHSYWYGGHCARVRAAEAAAWER